MKKAIFLLMLVSLYFSATGLGATYKSQDAHDPRGPMKPWDKGAWETGQYRNVFIEAGYTQEDIDAKLAKAYYDRANIHLREGRFSAAAGDYGLALLRWIGWG